MKLRGLSLLALILALAALGAWLWFGREGTPSPIPDAPDTAKIARNSPTNDVNSPVPPIAPTAPAIASAEPVRIASSVVPGMPLARSASTPPAPKAALAGGKRPSAAPLPQAEGKEDAENVQRMLRDFHTRMGENPVGSNAEIMKAVMGGNPVNARLGPPPGQSLNGEGELMDRWGTPYFFHQLTKDSMEVRSAGPDHTMWTADDLVTK